MAIQAFTDGNDGYYQLDVPPGTPLPEWAQNLTPCALRTETLPVPGSVTMRQARLALLQSNLLPSVTSAIAAANAETQITWEYATEVQRSNPLVLQLGTALGLSSKQLDDLFTLAATL